MLKWWKRLFQSEVVYLLDVGVKKYKSWRTLRNEVLRCYPECNMCGTDSDLEVHHIQPKHIKPHLALSWDNLIVLCRDCHLHLGHCNNFKNYNGNIVEIAEYSKRNRKILKDGDPWIKGF